ncbi:hypothetical protein QBC33DRAFT_596731 [Phialemonium atrogriseum]|uniref:Uncharacterized protein n=1 Tax=Phialemonium atrogriseum TaxID=1093897 RepID=A0AAJ0BVP5_9PEZI|nr:uncharacterized protein QBC33DRAFT_596731 [Phialemonium atrogriseum]KAK1763912.1 hypothetical protein QBC33DRAFT_596731 [Phialemonium atrogriseum]
MRPVNIETISLSSAFFRDRALLLLNLNRFAVRNIEDALDESLANVTSKNGLILPREIWDMILKEVASKDHDTNDRFCLVQANCITEIPKGKILLCRRAELQGVARCGTFQRVGDVEAFEAWSTAPYEPCGEPSNNVSKHVDPSTWRIDHPDGPSNEFAIRLSSSLPEMPFLYQDIEVPDIERCTGGLILSELYIFQRYCGDKVLVNPFYSETHKPELREELWALECTLKSRIYGRIEELGYDEDVIEDVPVAGRVALAPAAEAAGAASAPLDVSDYENCEDEDEDEENDQANLFDDRGTRA